MREQIEWQQQPYSHNQACLDLIAAKPHGILRILDDQCGFPQVGQCVCLLIKKKRKPFASSRQQDSISRERIPTTQELKRSVARLLKSFVIPVN